MDTLTNTRYHSINHILTALMPWVCGAGVVLGVLGMTSMSMVILFGSASLLQIGTFVVAQKHARGVFFCIALFVIGWMSGSMFGRLDDIPPLPFEGDFSGEIIEQPEYQDASARYVLLVNLDNRDRIRVRVTLAPHPQYTVGDVLFLRGVIQEPQSFRLPSGAYFDYKQFLSRRRIVATSQSPQVLDVGEPSHSIQRALFATKVWLVARVRRVVSYPENAMIEGMLFGAKDDFSEELRSLLVRTGLIHIVVLSGFNMTIVALGLSYMLTRIPRRLSVWIIAGVLFLFALFAGGTAPAWRAAGMTTLALYARWYGQEYYALRALGVVVVLFALVTPRLFVYDASLHLSVLATLGIIVLTTPVACGIDRIVRLPSWLREVLATTLATQVVVTPYLLALTHSFSVIGSIANILIVPLVAPTMAGGAIAVVCANVPVVGVVVGSVVSWFVRLQLWIVELLGQIPFASVAVYRFAWGWAILVYSIGVAVYVWWWYRIQKHTPRERV